MKRIRSRSNDDSVCKSPLKYHLTRGNKHLNHKLWETAFLTWSEPCFSVKCLCILLSRESVLESWFSDYLSLSDDVVGVNVSKAPGIPLDSFLAFSVTDVFCDNKHTREIIWPSVSNSLFFRSLVNLVSFPIRHDYTSWKTEYLLISWIEISSDQNIRFLLLLF